MAIRSPEMIERKRLAAVQGQTLMLLIQAQLEVDRLMVQAQRIVKPHQQRIIVMNDRQSSLLNASTKSLMHDDAGCDGLTPPVLSVTATQAQPSYSSIASLTELMAYSTWFTMK